LGAAATLAGTYATSWFAFIPLLALAGFGFGLGWTFANVATQDVVHPDRAGEASGVLLTVLVSAGGFGLAAAATPRSSPQPRRLAAAAGRHAAKRRLSRHAARPVADRVRLGRRRACDQGGASTSWPHGAAEHVSISRRDRTRSQLALDRAQRLMSPSVAYLS